VTLAEEETLSTFHEVGSKYIYPHHLVNSKRLTTWYFCRHSLVSRGHNWCGFWRCGRVKKTHCHSREEKAPLEEQQLPGRRQLWPLICWLILQKGNLQNIAPKSRKAMPFTQLCWRETHSQTQADFGTFPREQFAGVSWGHRSLSPMGQPVWCHYCRIKIGLLLRQTPAPHPGPPPPPLPSPSVQVLASSCFPICRGHSASQESCTWKARKGTSSTPSRWLSGANLCRLNVLPFGNPETETRGEGGGQPLSRDWGPAG